MEKEDLSNALGWMSIACWIVVYTPQFIENYKLKSGEGLSVSFIVIWLLGDLCSLLGALMAKLQSTVIMLAGYYLACDVALLCQIFYYRRIHPGHFSPRLSAQTYDSIEAEEHTPLLCERDMKEVERSVIWSRFMTALRYVLLVVFVAAAGMIAWLVTSANKSRPGLQKPKDVIEWKSQLLGWISALAYLGARVPQIMKNFTTKCEGLSLALFLFAIAGNVTYAASICVESMSPQHLIANASWLAGSTLTVFLDIFVLCQFFYYRTAESRFISETSTLVNEA